MLFHFIRHQLQSFLLETSAHGFKYLVSKNRLERVLWALVIAMGFLIAGTMIVRSWKETENNPILTTIDTISISQIPFPAITIDAGDVINPWGFVEKVYDHAEFVTDDDPLAEEPASQLRLRHNELIKAVVDRMGSKIEDSLKDKTLEELEAEKDQMAFSNKYGYFGNAVAMLSTLRGRGGELKTLEAIYKDIMQRAAVDTLGKITRDNTDKVDRNFGSELITPIIKEAAKVNNITLQDYLPCLKDKSACDGNYYKEYYIKMLVPFTIHKHPFRELGFGRFMSFFTDRMAAALVEDGGLQGLENHITFLNSKAGEPLKAYEMNMADDFRTLAWKMSSGQPNINMSVFELAQWVDIPYYPDQIYPNPDHQSPYLQKEARCDPRVYTPAWQSYTNMPDKYKLVKGYGDFLPDGLLPCAEDSTPLTVQLAFCCNLTNSIARHYQTILKVMKYAQQVPTFYQHQDEYLSDFGNISELVEFKVHDDLEKNLRTFNARIFMCQYEKIPEEMSPNNCNLFTRSYTNTGLGYSFNLGRFWDTYQNTTANTDYYNIMHTRNDQAIAAYFEEGEKEKGVFSPTSIGSSSGVRIVLQLNNYVRVPNDEQHVFRIAIGSPLDSVDMRIGFAELEPEFHYIFHVTPSEVLSSDSIRGLEPKRRRCRFRSENDGMILFKDYTRKGCYFECQLKRASEMCQCIPWNYPQIMEAPKICDFMGVECFEAVMGSSIQSCHCMWDCSEYRYSYYMSSKKLDLEKLCKEGSKTSELYGGEGFNRDDTFMRTYMELVENKDVKNSTLCREALRKTAFVDFQLTSQMANQINRGLRVTLSDYVSGFGGTLGLFTGISVLSIVEFAFWLMKSILGIKIPAQGNDNSNGIERNRGENLFPKV